MRTKRIGISLVIQIPYRKDGNGGNVDGVLRFSLYKYLIVKMKIVLSSILHLILFFKYLIEKM